jgi:hypothetical protein
MFMRKKTKNLNNKEHYVGALLENMDSKIDVLVDGHRVLDGKIDKHYYEFQDFRKEVNYKFDIVFEELHLIRNELKEKVGRDEFILLEKRVFALEKSRK